MCLLYCKDMIFPSNNPQNALFPTNNKHFNAFFPTNNKHFYSLFPTKNPLSCTQLHKVDTENDFQINKFTKEVISARFVKILFIRVDMCATTHSQNFGILDIIGQKNFGIFDICTQKNFGITGVRSPACCEKPKHYLLSHGQRTNSPKLAPQQILFSAFDKLLL